MKDFSERLEDELKWRYAACEDHAATPSGILLAVLNAVAAARMTPEKAAEALGASLTSAEEIQQLRADLQMLDQAGARVKDSKFGRIVEIEQFTGVNERSPDS